jgi:hypothetical protein
MAHSQSQGCNTPQAFPIPKKAQVMFTVIQRVFPRTFSKIWERAYNIGHTAGWNAGTKHQQSTWNRIETR